MSSCAVGLKPGKCEALGASEDSALRRKLGFTIRGLGPRGDQGPHMARPNLNFKEYVNILFSAPALSPRGPKMLTCIAFACAVSVPVKEELHGSWNPDCFVTPQTEHETWQWTHRKHSQRGQAQGVTCR